ncbi:MAG: membrane protein insertase YidC, partial [Proteobacteria bacterium]|nr:membrane protein insertase YidC [Pseudomonadota bacterium]
VMENDLLAVDLSSRSASVVGARLKQYQQSLAAGSPPVALLSAPSGADLAGAIRLLETAPEWGQVYEIASRDPHRITYRWTAPSGLALEKTYSLEPGRYDLSLDVRVVNGTGGVVRDRLGLLLVQDFSSAQDQYAFTGPAYFKAGSLEEVKLKAVKDTVKEPGEVAWAALLEKYFLVAALPSNPENALRIAPYLGQEKVVEMELDGPAFELAPGTEHAASYRLYLGPKLPEALAPLGSNLQDVVHYGFFHVIAKPLMVFLNIIYEFTGNYGIAIILLTTLIKAVFWPLSARSFKSMQRMKELQPKMQRIKEKYGKDKERMNVEVMQLYKSHKVNPLGGCLPMLVQIPFFFALYKILLGSIELRHAPFFFWIQDLSAKDPYYITPLLMGASMFLQQKMTPVTGDNAAQMKMMMYGMPAIFTFMFLNFPSGLVVYWLVNNLLSIAQQAMLLRKPRPA